VHRIAIFTLSRDWYLKSDASAPSQTANWQLDELSPIFGDGLIDQAATVAG
jgi:hypothetical protein